MRTLQKLIEKARPNFEKGGRMAAFEPVFNAVDNFFFATGRRTQYAPHVRDPLDIKRFMSMVIVALLPCLFASIYFFGLRIIAMIIVSYAVGGAVEVVFAIVRKEEINEGFLVTGLLFPLILPPGTPFWMVGLGVAFGVFAGKELFGGTGRNVFNPALVGRCFLSLAYPAQMAGRWVMPGSGFPGHLVKYLDGAAVDVVTKATPLAQAKQGLILPLREMFLGNITGSSGETSALAIIVGGVFLLATGVANWRTVASILASVAVLSAIFNFADPQRFAPAMWHLCAGGIMTGAFFMATDPVTSPITNEAKWAYGIIIGIVTCLIRNFTGYVEGVTFAILLGNITAPILDEAAVKLRLRRLNGEG
ncbi:MAG: RnfABCDGE type electron transport complex subunit D [Planctomycetota bacterium]